jgi:hypothetical protein
MILHPRRGIDQLNFGLQAEEVVNILGKPSKIFVNSDDENELNYEYNHLKLRLTFYGEEQGRLGYIRTANPKVTFKGQPIMGQTIEQLTDEVFNELGDWEVENFDFFDVYLNEENWMVLNVEYNTVTDIELGVVVNEDEEYEWPE